MSETARGTPAKNVRVDVLRSQLGRARGLGSARSGTAHWWGLRLTSLALIPLTVWFILAVFRLEHSSQPEVARWAANPLNATLLVATVLITFHHMQAGLQVVIEDYIHAEPAKTGLLLANKAIAALLGLACAIAALKLAFTG